MPSLRDEYKWHTGETLSHGKVCKAYSELQAQGQALHKFRSLYKAYKNYKTFFGVNHFGRPLDL